MQSMDLSPPLVNKVILIVIRSYFHLNKLLLAKLVQVSLQVSPMQDGQTHIY